MVTQIDINLPEGVFHRFQKTHDFVNDKVNSLTQSAQQTKQSLQETATKATDKAVDTVTTVTSDSVNKITETIEQTKGSLEEKLQTAGQIKNTTSDAIQTAIESSASDWLQQHPVVLRLVQILAWGINHPIISLLILLVAIAIAWSIIKGIVRLIETASWSILQFPFKLIIIVTKFSFASLTGVSSLAVKQLTSAKTSELPALLPATSPPVGKDKKQRLGEISARLEAIQKEQNELLEEAAAILEADKVDSY